MGRVGQVSCFSPEALAFLRALKRHNDREWFKPRKERYESLLREPMAALVERLAIDFRSFAPGSGRQPEDVDVSDLPRHPLLGKQGALQDAHRRHLSLPRPAQAPGRRPLFRSGARRRLDRRRHVRARHVAASGGPRTHRRQRPAAARDRRIAGVQAHGRHARRRTPAARAARLSQGSRGRGVPAIPAVSRRTRDARGVRDEPALLRRRAERLSEGRAAHSVSQRAAPGRVGGRTDIMATDANAGPRRSPTRR